MLYLYSLPFSHLVEQSHGTLLVCRYLGKDRARVVDVTAIESVVGMAPFPLMQAEKNQPEIVHEYANSFYVIEKPCAEISKAESENIQNSEDPEEDNANESDGDEDEDEDEDEESNNNDEEEEEESDNESEEISDNEEDE